ncbi:MAG: transcriptional repressor LexA [Clostridia bacterium]|nr:transcriptional repressor LexA [Clostridia bacterium]
MKKKGATDKQQKVLDFVKESMKRDGYAPSVREICKALDLKSTSTVHGYLVRLEKKGLIQRAALKPRTLRIVGSQDAADEKGFYSSKEMVDVPIVGKVTAGLPILAVENIEDSFPLPVDFVGNSESFMLKVRGDSMIDAGILDGDLVLVKKQNTAENGDIVVALIEDEATVKKFYKEKNFIRLQPQNQFMQPIIVPDCTILGKVAGVFRRL